MSIRPWNTLMENKSLAWDMLVGRIPTSVTNTVPNRTNRYRSNRTALAKKCYKLISKFASIKYWSILFYTRKYQTVLVFSVKYRSVYTNLKKISNFCTLMFFIFWNSKWYEPGITIYKSGMSRCGKKGTIAGTVFITLIPTIFLISGKVQERKFQCGYRFSFKVPFTAFTFRRPDSWFLARQITL